MTENPITSAGGTAETGGVIVLTDVSRIASLDILSKRVEEMEGEEIIAAKVLVDHIAGMFNQRADELKSHLSEVIWEHGLTNPKAPKSRHASSQDAKITVTKSGRSTISEGKLKALLEDAGVDPNKVYEGSITIAGIKGEELEAIEAQVREQYPKAKVTHKSSLNQKRIDGLIALDILDAEDVEATKDTKEWFVVKVKPTPSALEILGA